MDPIIAFRSWEVVIMGTWIWLRRSTKFRRCLYEAMSKPYKDMLAYEDLIFLSKCLLGGLVQGFYWVICL